MNVSLGQRWQRFVDEAVRSGRYASESEVLREGLRLVEERDAKLAALRETIQASLAEGGSLTSEEVHEAIEAEFRELAKLGF